MRVAAPRPLAVAVPAMVGYLVLYRLGLTHGSTAQEHRSSLAGDDVVRRPQVIATHAGTLPAPPEQVWPWLMQVGWHRGGWYTPRWVDMLLFPDNRPSADRLLEGYPPLKVGDFVPDGPPSAQCGFVVRAVSPTEHLVLESTTHLPLSWRRNGWAHLHWSWSFVLRPANDGRATRLVFRWRARTSPWWLTVAAHLVIVPADFVMSRGMIRGLRQRVAHCP